MKLNLLPATVSRGRQSKTAWVISIVIIFVGIGISLAMTLSSAKALADAKQAYDDSVGPAQRAYQTSQVADQLMQDPKVSALAKNVSLAQAMIAHNDRYPDLYNSLLRYIPPFYRLTSIAASPASDTQSSVTLVGTLTSYQQYADLMLALMRNPEAVSVARSGYTADEQYVPNLTQVDQQGRPRNPGQAPIPDNPLERLAFFEANASDPNTFTGQGNFGTGTTATRLAMAGESLVTVQLVINHPLQVPNPRATLGGGGGGAVGGPPMGGPPMGGPPMGGSAPGRPNMPGGGAPSAPAAGGGAGRTMER
jgi:Tfp pilus assembly protein PilN